MKIKKPTRADWLNAQAIDAVDHAIDSSLNQEECEAWYEAMEAVLLWQYPNGNEKVEAALELVRNVIDERYSPVSQSTKLAT